MARYDWYPMIRGRLVAVNGKPVGPDNYTDDRAKRLVDREFNLSNAVEAPPHNQVVAGRWTPGEEGAIGVEKVARPNAGPAAGDRLQFDMGGVQDEARITSLRKVDWGSMRANFFVMYPVARSRGRSGDLPRRLPRPRNPRFRQCAGAPVSQHHQCGHGRHHCPGAAGAGAGDPGGGVLFAFTLAAGLVVLFAAVTATREERAGVRHHAGRGFPASLLRQVQRPNWWAWAAGGLSRPVPWPWAWAGRWPATF